MKIAFLDLEFTRKPYDSTFINEIIEMSCISCQVQDEYSLNNDGYIISQYSFLDKKSNKFTTLIRPTINTFITKEIAEYTGVNSRTLESEGITLEEAINLLYTYLRKNDIVRIYIYASYSRDLLVGAKKILRGRLDKKIDYIINLLKDVSYYSLAAREKLAKEISFTSNFEVRYCKEKLMNKKKLSLSDTYLILLNKKEVSIKSKIKSLADANIIKDIFFACNKNIESELGEIAYRIELKRERKYSVILEKRDLIDLICSANSSEELKKYKNENLEIVMRAIIYIIKEFKSKIADDQNIKLSSINKNEKWLSMYVGAIEAAKDIKSVYGLNVKSVKDCVDIIIEKEKQIRQDKLDAKATSMLMETGDDLEKFKELVSSLDDSMIKVLVKKCEEFLSVYNNGHTFRIYKTKLNILSNI